MGYFRIEEHLQRHQELLQERANDRLVSLATENGATPRVRPIEQLRHLVAWLRIGQPDIQTPPTIQPAAVRSSPRPLVE